MANTAGKDLLREHLPGTGRVALQVYVGQQIGYRQPPGYSEAHIKIKNVREAKRLWEAIEKVIDRREWTDDYAERAQVSGGSSVTIHGPVGEMAGQT